MARPVALSPLTILRVFIARGTTCARYARHLRERERDKREIVPDGLRRIVLLDDD